MKIYSQRIRHLVSIFSLFLVLGVFLTGCAPLRKKFIRQKKKDKESTGDFIPVLEPEVYPVKTMGPADVYAQQYSLFNVWISDYADNFETANNDKRLVNDLEAALKSLEQMISFVKSPLSEELTAIKTQVQLIRGEYSKPESFRNRSKINSELRDLDRTMRKNYKPAMVQEWLKNE